MFDDDSAARRALNTLTDEPAPPVMTTLDQVLRRGRRRVLVQRTGTVAAAVLMVATIGVGAMLLRPDASHDNDVRVATSAPAPVDGPLPGWRYVGPPDGKCENAPDVALPAAPDISLLPVEIVEKAFTNSVERVMGDVPTTVGRYWLENSPKHDAPAGQLTAEVPMSTGGGNGQIQLEAYRYGGTPTEMADASVNVYGFCTRPARHVLDDGTILQLYTVNDIAPAQPTQPLQIYRPDGRQYIVTAAGYSEADLVPLDGGASTIRGGRGALPTTERQLADLALALVSWLS
jgi:hypothetical protein